MASDEPAHGGFWHHRASYELNSKIMLTAVISLTVVIIFVIILHIYVRIVLGRRARAGQQLGHTVTQITLNEPPKRGLDPSIIAALPVFVFKQANPNDECHYSTSDNNVVECAVCLSMLEDEETARFLPNCKHIFHSECIDKWLSSNSTCPICRTEAQPRVQPEEVNAQEAGNGGVQTYAGVAAESSVKVGGSGSRISSFRRMLSRERSSRRVQYCGQHEQGIDLERQ